MKLAQLRFAAFRRLFRQLSTFMLLGLFLSISGCVNLGGVPNSIGQESSKTEPSIIANYSIVYAFTGGVDGNAPEGPLLAVNGKLIGTTFVGGLHQAGAVFELTTSGREDVLYSFGNHKDGADPFGNLVYADGAFWGTAAGGGIRNGGAVFAVSESGTERVLHSFVRNSGIWFPQGGLIDVNGDLYGTTYLGGTGCGSNSGGCGTVFKMTKSGRISIVHTFEGSDGANPTGGLISVNGTLYGTTFNGGTACVNKGGCGTVFKVTTSGVESVLYSFKGGRDGAQPRYVSLIYVKGRLYGTTAGGGDSKGHGVVFELSMTGKERVIYRFRSGSDGYGPFAGLSYLNGWFYGTTFFGGEFGWGTIFKVNASGTERVLHSFISGTDGTNPHAALTYLDGAFYGTAEDHGSGSSGVVFRITP